MTTQERNRIASETGYADAMGAPDPLPPCCQYCRAPIRDGRSRYLHEKCAGILRTYKYHVRYQRDALANYAAERPEKE